MKIHKSNAGSSPHRRRVLPPIIIALLCWSQPAGAASPADDEILGLYFSEEQLFESATRHLKPLTRVPENVTIITADEIKAMNGLTVFEIVERAAGLFVQHTGDDFGGEAFVFIQDSEFDQVLVLIDGVRFNSVASGYAMVNGLPVQIIDRIEIIKGPASSAWGSSLGGVINIITQKTGDRPGPHGMIGAALGESDSSLVQGELRGRQGRLGYYLFGGRQDSNGLRAGRFFENNSFYAKLNMVLPADLDLLVTLGTTESKLKYGDFRELDFGSTGASRDRFATATLDAGLTANLDLNISLHALAKEYDQKNFLLGTGLLGGPAGEPYFFQDNDEFSYGGSSRLVLSGVSHTGVLGAEYERGKLDRVFYYGPAAWGPFTDVAATAKDERLAVYLNDTLLINNLTLVPGIRYDSHSISTDFVSPSLGATYRLTDDTILRGSVARGFNSPFLAIASVSSPTLEPLTVWSYQAGIETSAPGWLRAKVSLFQHDIDDVWQWDYDNGYYINAGTGRRRGFEVEAQTRPFHRLSLNANFTFVRGHASDTLPDDEIYAANLIIDYHNPDLVKAQLYGHFVHWSDYRSAGEENGKFNTMLWDLNVAREVFARPDTAVELFVTIRNLFNGAQYWSEFYKNPDRWVLAGARLSF